MDKQQLEEKLYEKLTREEVALIFWAKIRVLIGGMVLGWTITMLMLK